MTQLTQNNYQKTHDKLETSLKSKKVQDKFYLTIFKSPKTKQIFTKHTTNNGYNLYSQAKRLGTNTVGFLNQNFTEKNTKINSSALK